jgi:hypothetical protein
MMRRLTLGASIVLILSSTSPPTSFNLVTDVAAQGQSSQSSQPREQSPTNMQDMMKMHEQMTAEMKAAESRLDALVGAHLTGWACSVSGSTRGSRARVCACGLTEFSAPFTLVNRYSAKERTN